MQVVTMIAKRLVNNGVSARLRRSTDCSMAEESPHLRRMRELSPMLDIADIVTRNVEGITEYATERGTSHAIGLFKDPKSKVAVARSFISSGGIIPGHAHEEKEIFIVYSGKVCITDLEGDHLLGVGDVHCIPPNTAHRREALEDSWLITITIPASDSYPEER